MIRVACGGLIYRKALRISKSSTKEGQAGTIINLLSNDSAKICETLSFIFDVWRGPLEAIAFFFIIYMEIGNAAFVGYAFLCSFIPLKSKRMETHSKVLSNLSINSILGNFKFGSVKKRHNIECKKRNGLTIE